jgi:hypothetical protein
MKKLVVTVILSVIVIAALCVLSYMTIRKSKEQESFAQDEINAYKIEKQEETEKEKEYNNELQKLLEEVPGIVCWGDDMTAGQGSTGVTYPDVLKTLLLADSINIPVINMGITDESSLEVLGRCGAIPFIVAEDMTLAGNGYVSEFQLKNINGAEVFPLMHNNNPGVNPVKVNGIDCTFYGHIISSTDHSVNGYYLARAEQGEDTVIPAGTVIETSGMDYGDYINILCIGQNGGYTSLDDLTNQIDLFISKLGKNKDKYIILGYASSSAEFENALAQKYGEHFLNTRDYLVENGLADAKLQAKGDDENCIQNGIVPSSLRSDENNLNNNGYNVVGNFVYDSLKNLGYLPESSKE